MNGYGGLAPWYDRLMAQANYPARADYLLRVFRRHAGKAPASLLDLACGTGTLTRLLAERGIEMIGVDASPDMLAQAREKTPPETDILWVCQDLRSLDLFGTAAGAVCTLDGVNHLTGEGDLAAFFGRLACFLDPGGLFVFDANTPYKHARVLADHTFVYDLPDVFCVWQNQTDGTLTRITLDLFTPEGGGYRRETDRFCERGYSTEELTAAATGFDLLAVYDDLQFDPPVSESQRVVYVMKKR